MISRLIKNNFHATINKTTSSLLTIGDEMKRDHNARVKQVGYNIKIKKYLPSKLDNCKLRKILMGRNKKQAEHTQNISIFILHTHTEREFSVRNKTIYTDP